MVAEPDSRPFVAVDFDGTCVRHAFPAVGADVGAAPVLRKMSEGFRLILFTMRSGQGLADAVRWFADRNVPLFGVNRNPTQGWSDSPKCYAHYYIDDAAVGCPLVVPEDGTRPYVDWKVIAHIFNISL